MFKIEKLMTRLDMKSKLIALAAVPSLVLVIISIFVASEKLVVYLKQKDLTKASLALSLTNSLIYNLQLERGMSVVLTQSRGKYLSEKLDDQKKRTDAELKTFRKNYPHKISRYLQRSIADIDGERKRIVSYKEPVSKILNFYTGIIDGLLENSKVVTTEIEQKLMPISKVPLTS